MAFKIKPTDSLYLATDKRVKICDDFISNESPGNVSFFFKHSGKCYLI
jgi:hypothetical protein